MKWALILLSVQSKDSEYQWPSEAPTPVTWLVKMNIKEKCPEELSEFQRTSTVTKLSECRCRLESSILEGKELQVISVLLRLCLLIFRPSLDNGTDLKG